MASYPMGTGGKARPGRDADHSPPSSAEVKYEWELYLLSPPCASMACSGTALLFLVFMVNCQFANCYYVLVSDRAGLVSRELFSPIMNFSLPFSANQTHINSRPNCTTALSNWQIRQLPKAPDFRAGHHASFGTMYLNFSKLFPNISRI
jgi:hypothetical protein